MKVEQKGIVETDKLYLKMFYVYQIWVKTSYLLLLQKIMMKRNFFGSKVENLKQRNILEGEENRNCLDEVIINQKEPVKRTVQVYGIESLDI